MCSIASSRILIGPYPWYDRTGHSEEPLETLTYNVSDIFEFKSAENGKKKQRQFSSDHASSTIGCSLMQGLLGLLSISQSASHVWKQQHVVQRVFPSSHKTATAVILKAGQLILCKLNNSQYNNVGSTQECALISKPVELIQKSSRRYLKTLICSIKRLPRYLSLGLITNLPKVCAGQYLEALFFQCSLRIAVRETCFIFEEHLCCFHGRGARMMFSYLSNYRPLWWCISRKGHKSMWFYVENAGQY